MKIKLFAMTKSTLFIFLSLLLFSSAQTSAQQTPYNTLIRGKLDKVVDGDTIRIVGYKEAFRLYGIDAVETKQDCTKNETGKVTNVPYGKMATQFLKKETLHEYLDTVISCDFNKKDRYGRPLATCYATNDIYKDINLNKLMVFRGRAFADRKYTKNPDYIKLEDIAKKNHWGVWHGGIDCELPQDFRAKN